jgi:PBSX family phage portal protein
MTEQTPARARRREWKPLASTAKQRERMQRAVENTSGAGESRAIDLFKDDYSDGDVLRPPYDLDVLARTAEVSDTVFKCAEAMATNIGGHGVAFIQAEDAQVPDVEESDPEWKPIEAERLRLKRFFRYVSIEGSLQWLRKRYRMDLELTGNGYLEVVRRADGSIERLEHLPSATMRLRRRSAGFVEFPFWERDTESGKWERITRMHRPRTFVQRLPQTDERTYFKEFGDPRVLDAYTGLFEGEQGQGEVPLSRRASEVVHFANYVNGLSPYGVPRWISALHHAAGRAAAAEKNSETIESNGLPSLLLLLHGAQDVDKDVERLQQQFVEASSGEASPHLMILPLAPADADPLDTQGGMQPKASFVKLNDLQQKDALYLTYMDRAEKDIVGVFRLPGIIIGRSDDYTRSTAETAKRVAQEQVFQPEARLEDYWFNERLLPDLGVIFWQVQTMMAPTSDETVVGAVVQALSAAGGITPRMAAEVAQRYLGIKAKPSAQPFEDVSTSFLQSWISAGTVPPPPSLLEALGVFESAQDASVEPITPEDPEDAPMSGESRRVKRARALRHRLRSMYGQATAQVAIGTAADIVRMLLEARRKVEAADAARLQDEDTGEAAHAGA